MNFKLGKNDLRRHLRALAKVDADIAAALKHVGYPAARQSAGGYRRLMNIIVAQQLSTKAAATIIGRLVDATAPRLTPPRFLALGAADLRAIGLSRQKIEYATLLSEAVAARRFVPGRLKHMPDEEALEAIVALKGFGRWSAEMYLMFSLGRPDVWPADDLAVQEAVKRLKGLKARPGQKQMDEIAEGWRPHRSSAAILMWHFYANTPPV